MSRQLQKISRRVLFPRVWSPGPKQIQICSGCKTTTFPAAALPHLIFKAPLFSLSLLLLSPQVPDRGKEEEEEEELEGGGALNEWSARCLEIFCILFTAGGLEPRNRRQLAEKPSAWTQLLSHLAAATLSAPCCPTFRPHQHPPAPEQTFTAVLRKEGVLFMAERKNSSTSPTAF